MAAVNTGKVEYANLKLIYVDSGLPTGSEKANNPSDPDYIPPTTDLADCPPPAGPDTTPNTIEIDLVNNTTEAISLTSLMFRGESNFDPTKVYFSAPLASILPGHTNILVTNKSQVDDLTRTTFTINGLSKNIRVHAKFNYKISTDPVYTTEFESDLSLGDIQNSPINTLRGAAALNRYQIVFTENPLPPPVILEPPAVDAGIDQALTTDDLLSLNGTATSPNVGGSIASVAWTQVSGPTAAIFALPTSSATTVTNLAAGIYVFKLTAIDDGGRSANDTVQITVTKFLNPNGLINVLVDPLLPDTSFQITQITLVDPNNTDSSFSLLSDPIDNSQLVKTFSVPKGKYNIQVTIGGTIAETSLKLDSSSTNVQFNIPSANTYQIDNVVVDEGTLGVKIFYTTATFAPSFVIVYAKLTVDSPTISIVNELPNKLAVSQIGDVHVDFFSDEVGTIPTPFTGFVRVTQDVFNILTSTNSFSELAPAVVALNTIVVNNVQAYELFDYDVNPSDPVINQTVEESLRLSQGYLFVP